MTQFDIKLTHIDSQLTQLKKNLTDINEQMTEIDKSMTHIVSCLTEIDRYLTNIDGRLTLLDDNEKPLAIAFESTFAIYPVPAHSPIAKELSIPPNFAVSGNKTSLSKQICFSIS